MKIPMLDELSAAAESGLPHMTAGDMAAVGALVVAAGMLVMAARHPAVRSVFARKYRDARFCAGCRYRISAGGCQLHLDLADGCGLIDARVPLTGVRITVEPGVRRAVDEAPGEPGEPAFSCTVVSTPPTARQRMGHGDAQASIALAEIAHRTTGQPVELESHGERTTIGKPPGEIETW